MRSIHATMFYLKRGKLNFTCVRIYTYKSHVFLFFPRNIGIFILNIYFMYYIFITIRKIKFIYRVAHKFSHNWNIYIYIYIKINKMYHVCLFYFTATLICNWNNFMVKGRRVKKGIILIHIISRHLFSEIQQLFFLYFFLSLITENIMQNITNYFYCIPLRLRRTGMQSY